MTRTVFVLGAGFSRAVSSHMPLMKDLPTVLTLGDNLRLDLEALTSDHDSDIERYLSYLAVRQPFLTEAENLRNRALFLDISTALASRLLDAQNRVLEEAIPDWLLDFVIHLHSTRSTVITLNYDHLLEKAGGSTPWHSDSEQLQGSHFWSVPITNINLREAAVLGSSPLKTFRVLKLHGSLGWVYSGSESFYGEAIYSLALNPGWHPDSDPDPDSRAVDKVPLIVPPTTGKSDFFNNETVRAQWQLAAAALRDASEVVVLGYSMPVSDFLVGGLLCQTNSAARRVFVDQSSEPAARLNRMTGHVWEHGAGFESDSPIPQYVASIGMTHP